MIAAAADASISSSRIGMFFFKVGKSFWLYAQKVPCSFLDNLGASIAGLAVSYSVGEGGLARHLHHRTCRSTARRRWRTRRLSCAASSHAWEETADLPAVLIGSGIWTLMTRGSLGAGGLPLGASCCSCSRCPSSRRWCMSMINALRIGQRQAARKPRSPKRWQSPAAASRDRRRAEAKEAAAMRGMLACGDCRCCWRSVLTVGVLGLDRPRASICRRRRKPSCIASATRRSAATRRPIDRSLVIPPAQIDEDLDAAAAGHRLRPHLCDRTRASTRRCRWRPSTRHAGAARHLDQQRPRRSTSRRSTRAIDLAKAHPEAVKAIIVGNEVLLRGEQTGETLADTGRARQGRDVAPRSPMPMSGNSGRGRRRC